MSILSVAHSIPSAVIELLPANLLIYLEEHREEVLSRFLPRPIASYGYEEWFKWYLLLLNAGIVSDPGKLVPAFELMSELMEESGYDYAQTVWAAGACRLASLAGNTEDGLEFASDVSVGVDDHFSKTSGMFAYMLPELQRSGLDEDARQMFQKVWPTALQTEQNHEICEPIFEYLAMSMPKYPINARIAQTLWRMRYLLTRNHEDHRPQPLTFHAYSLMFQALDHVSLPDDKVTVRRLPVFAPYDTLEGEEVTFAKLSQVSHEHSLRQLASYYEDEVLTKIPDFLKVLPDYIVTGAKRLQSILDEADMSAWRRCPDLFPDLDIPQPPILAPEQHFPAWTEIPPTADQEEAPEGQVIQPDLVCYEPILPNSDFDPFGRFDVEVDAQLESPPFPPTTDPSVWEAIFDLHKEIDRAELSAEDLLDRSALILLRLPQDNPGVGDLFAHLQVISLWPMLGSAAAAYQEMMKLQASLPFVEVDPQWQASLLLQQAAVWLRLDEHIRCCQLVDQAMSISAPNALAIRWFGLSQQIQASGSAGYLEDATRLSAEAVNLAWGTGLPWAKYEAASRFCFYADWDTQGDIAGLVGALTLFMDGSHPQLRGDFLLNPMMALCEYLYSYDCFRAAAPLWQSVYHYLKVTGDPRIVYVGDKYLQCLAGSHSYQHLPEAIKEFGKTALRMDSPESFAQWWTKLPVAHINNGKYGPVDDLNLVLLDSDILGWVHDIKTYTNPALASLYLASVSYEVGLTVLHSNSEDLEVPLRYMLQSAVYLANSDNYEFAARAMYWLAQATPIPEHMDLFLAAIASASHYAKQAPDLAENIREKISQVVANIKRRFSDASFLDDPEYYRFFEVGMGHVEKTVDYYELVSPHLNFGSDLEVE